MDFDEAVERMLNDKDPQFGIIVENTPDCLNFMNELEQHVKRRISTNIRTPLINYAFHGGENAVVITISKYEQGYDRWSHFESLEQIKRHAVEHADNVNWIMYTDICDNLPHINELLNILQLKGDV